MRANCSAHLSDMVINCSDVTKLVFGAEEDEAMVGWIGDESCAEDCADRPLGDWKVGSLSKELMTVTSAFFSFLIL